MSVLLFRIEIVILAFLMSYLLCFDKIVQPPTQEEAKIMVPVVETPQILGEAITVIPIPTSTPSPTPLPTGVPADIETSSPTPVKTKKESYTIAVYGDSMVDTMGENMEYLTIVLKNKYPKTEFKLYNYGIGSENVADGINRFSDIFNYQTRHYPSLPSLKPDIIILGSFAYNPYFPYDRKKYSTDLTQLLKKVKKITSDVYLLAEIAPLKKNFGVGKNGVNWPSDKAYEHATQIIDNLETAKEVAKILDTPIIDVFSQTQINAEKEGDKKYVNPDDGIHPSVEGHQFTAEKISEALKLQ